MNKKLRFWWWIFCKLGEISAYRHIKSFPKERGRYIAMFAEYIHRKKIAPYLPQRTSKERWEIILGENE